VRHSFFRAEVVGEKLLVLSAKLALFDLGFEIRDLGLKQSAVSFAKLRDLAHHEIADLFISAHVIFL
jgi:hypothetical protein